MTLLHLACWNQTSKDIFMYVLQKYKNVTTFYNIDKILPFQLACIWYEHLPTTILHKLLIHSRMLYGQQQEMINHFHCITSCKVKTVLWVTTNFFLNMDVSCIVANSKQQKRIAIHHCMPILQGHKCYSIATHLWSWNCQLFGQQGKSSYSLHTETKTIGGF